MRKLLYVFGGLVVFAVLVVSAVFYFTSGAVSAADGFFAKLASNGPAAAYADAAPALRKATSEAAFAKWADSYGLRSYKSSSWSNRSISGGTASVEGTLSLTDGGPLPVKVTLAKDDAGVWRVVAVDVSRVGTSSGGQQEAAPPDAAAASELAQVSMQQLAEAIQTKDFSSLQAATAPEFQQKFSSDALAQQFKGFTDLNLDLTHADMTQMTFSQPPSIDDDGRLVLIGTLPTPSQPWYFNFKYQNHGAWQLIGMNLSSKPG